jgi:hypothetical protein
MAIPLLLNDLFFLPGNSLMKKRIGHILSPFNAHIMKSSFIKIFPAFIACLIFISAFAQSKQKSSPWLFDKTVKNVELYHQVVDCNGISTILLKFVNNNKFQVSLSWDESFLIKERADTLNGIKGRKEIMLMAGTILETDCSDHQSVQLDIPETESGGHKNTVSHYEFRDVKVSPLK